MGKKGLFDPLIHIAKNTGGILAGMSKRQKNNEKPNPKHTEYGHKWNALGIGLKQGLGRQIHATGKQSKPLLG